MHDKPFSKAVSLFFLGFWLVFDVAGAQAEPGEPPAGHIILFIGDGMTIENEIAASRYLSGQDFELSFHKLPYQADMATWDVSTYQYRAGGRYDPKAVRAAFGYDPARGGNRPYPLAPEPDGARSYHLAKATDSASAATAWATGYKTDQGNIAWLPGDPEGGALKTIAELLRERRGYAIGIVSTVPFTHATPAAHVSHNKNRYNYGAIGTEILTVVKPEVVIGGGHPGCDGTPTHNFISGSDYSDFKNGIHSAEYVFVERAAGVDGGLSVMAAAQASVSQGKKLFGLYGRQGTGNFESPEPEDRPGSPRVNRATRENPTLAEATLAALTVLSRDPDGFFLMSEQGDIDWANHANDFRRMIGTIRDLHDGVQAVIDFVDRPGDGLDWDNTLLIVTADHGTGYMRSRKKLGPGDLPKQAGAGKCGYGGGTCTYPDGEVSYGSTGHTNELVRLYARGAGASKFAGYEGRWYPGTRILDNTQLFHMLMAAAGEPMPSPLSVK